MRGGRCVHFHFVANAGGDALISAFLQNREGRCVHFRIFENGGENA
jgi:hypothetical protein